jgi:nucleotide-binding universal stress UspA family protein
MFKHILLPTDGSDLSRKAILYGVQLAKECSAKVTGLMVIEPYHVAAMDAVLYAVSEDVYEIESRRFAEKALDQIVIAADAAGVPCDTIIEVLDQPYRAIIDVAHAKGCDLIDGLARAARTLCASARQRDERGPHPFNPVLVYR